MKRMIVAAMLACATLALAEGNNSAIEQNLTQTEKGLWETWKVRDVEPFKKVMADGVDCGGGVRSGDQVIKDIGSTQCTVTSYSLDTPTFKWIDKDTS